MNEEISAQISDAKSAPADRSENGPYDSSEMTEIRPFIDFGSIRINPDARLQLKLEVDEASKRVVAISVEILESKLQLQAFASPRSTGLWNEIRNQLSEQIKQQGGKVEDVDSPVGPSVIGLVSGKNPEGNVVSQKVQFIGVDGPRWFLRGVISGKAVQDEATFEEVLKVFRGVTIVRGNVPMPPRELLPIKVPTNPKQQSS